MIEESHAPYDVLFDLIRNAEEHGTKQKAGKCRPASMTFPKLFYSSRGRARGKVDTLQSKYQTLILHVKKIVGVGRLQDPFRISVFSAVGPGNRFKADPRLRYVQIEFGNNGNLGSIYIVHKEHGAPSSVSINKNDYWACTWHMNGRGAFDLSSLQLSCLQQNTYAG